MLSAVGVLLDCAKPLHPHSTSRVFEQGSTRAPCVENRALFGRQGLSSCTNTTKRPPHVSVGQAFTSDSHFSKALSQSLSRQFKVFGHLVLTSKQASSTEYSPRGKREATPLRVCTSRSCSKVPGPRCVAVEMARFSGGCQHMTKNPCLQDRSIFGGAFSWESSADHGVVTFITCMGSRTNNILSHPWCQIAPNRKKLSARS